MKDTAPEINAMIFAAMMRKTPEERMLMGFDMMATARQLVWSGISSEGSVDERRRLFFQRFHGIECPWQGAELAAGSEDFLFQQTTENTGFLKGELDFREMLHGRVGE